MVKRRYPDFMYTQDRHYYVTITEDMRSKAKDNYSSEIDKSDSRNFDRSSRDSKVGKLAELTVYKFFNDLGIEVEEYNGWEYDLIVNGKTVEVKTRDYTQTNSRYKDLLVRDRPDVDWNPGDVDYYIQVFLNGFESERGYITGYIDGKEVSTADFFEKAKTHRTRKVNFEDLNRFYNENIFK